MTKNKQHGICCCCFQIGHLVSPTPPAFSTRPVLFFFLSLHSLCSFWLSFFLLFSI